MRSGLFDKIILFFVFSGFVPEENYGILPDKGRISHKDAAEKAVA